MRKTFILIHTIICALICFFGISFSFISGETIGNFLVKTLKIKTTPSFTGGIIIKEFYDDSGDDNGYGKLCYPENEYFKKGALDLVHYAVHEPVYEARWQAYPEYWQLDLEYKNSTKEVSNIMIYLDIDGDGNGSFESLTDNAEKVSFDSEHPWDYAVWICNGAAKIYDSQKNMVSACQVFFLNDEKSIVLRIPLQMKELQKIYTAEKTYHYVITGAYSKFDLGGFMPIENVSSISHGSTVSPADYNDLISPVYDVLGDNSQLGKWNEDTKEKTVLVPMEVDMKLFKLKNTESDADDNSAFIEEVKAKMAADKNFSNDEEDSVFGFSTLQEAEAHFKSQVKENPNDARALAYLASCIAKRGGQANAITAMKLVNDAFYYFDLAVKNATPENEFEVLINRASVSVAVPDMVFGKTESGANDFMKCAEISKRIFPENKTLTAHLYISASEAFTSVGKKTESNLAIQEAKKIFYNGSKGAN